MDALIFKNFGLVYFAGRTQIDMRGFAVILWLGSNSVVQARSCILEADMLRASLEMCLKLPVTSRLKIGMWSVHLINLSNHHCMSKMLSYLQVFFLL